MFKLGLQLMTLFGELRRRDLVGGILYLGMGSEVSKPSVPFLVLSLLGAQHFASVAMPSLHYQGQIRYAQQDE